MGSIRIVRINGVSRMQAQFVPALLRSPGRRLYSRHRSVYRKYSIVTPENATAVRPSPPAVEKQRSALSHQLEAEAKINFKFKIHISPNSLKAGRRER